MIKEIIHSLSLVPDAILRSVYVRECSSRLQIEEQTLINELNKQVRANQKKKTDFQSPVATTNSEDSPPEDFFSDDPDTSRKPEIESYRAQSQEADIMRILVKYANQTLVFHEVDDKKRPVEVHVRVGDFVLSELLNDGLEPENPDYHTLFALISETGENPYPEEAFFLHHLDPVISSTAIHLTSNPYTLSEHWKEKHQVYVTDEEALLRKMVLTAVYSFKLRRVLMMLRAAEERMKEPLDDVGLFSVMESCLGLQNAKMELGKQLSYVIL